MAARTGATALRLNDQQPEMNREMNEIEGAFKNLFLKLEEGIAERHVFASKLRTKHNLREVIPIEDGSLVIDDDAFKEYAESREALGKDLARVRALIGAADNIYGQIMRAEKDMATAYYSTYTMFPTTYVVKPVKPSGQSKH